MRDGILLLFLCACLTAGVCHQYALAITLFGAFTSYWLVTEDEDRPD